MSNDNGKERQVLLAVLAHPDDETFGTGGTLALYAARGAAVHLVCATRGEAGSMDADCLDGFETIADRRVHELRCAAGVLGLAGVHYLDYRDSGMSGSPDNYHPNALAAASLDEVAGKVAHTIRLLRPQVVITFDPIGGYRHPDHIAIQRATVKAFELSGDPLFHPDDLPPYKAQKLYFHTFPRRWLRFLVRVMPLLRRDPHKWGRNGDIDLASLAIDDFPVHAVIDYSAFLDRKIQASNCHASQGGGAMMNGPLGWLTRLTGARDMYMRAYPEPGDKKEEDLFEAVEF